MPKKKTWWVYMVRCRDGSLYTGSTNDIPRRLRHHNAGQGGGYTRARHPVRLVWKERKRNRSYALRREWEIKQWPRARKLSFLKDTFLRRAKLSPTPFAKSVTF